MSHPCPAECGRFFINPRAMNQHLSSNKGCNWFAKGTLEALGLEDIVQPLIHLEIPPRLAPEEEDIEYNLQQDEEVEDVDFGPFRRDFHFIPNVPEVEIGIGVAGPGPQTAINQILRQADPHQQHRILDDDDDSRVVDIDPKAGRIYRKGPPPTYIPADKDGDIAMNEVGAPPNLFSPFKSELDWRIAQWAVKDGPGHNAIDRLLEIPGVRISI